MRVLKLLAVVALGAAALLGGALALLHQSPDAPPPEDAALRPGEAKGDEGNAQPDFLALSAALRLSGPEREFLKTQFESGVTDPAAVAALIERNADALEVFARFAAGKRFEDPAYRDHAKVTNATPVPQFFPLVGAAHLAALRSEQKLRAGRAHEAVVDAMLVCDAADVLLRSEQPLIVPLIGFLLADIGARAVHRVVAAGGLDAVELKSVASRLMSHKSGAEALQAGLRYEYLMGANMVADLPRYAGQAPEGRKWYLEKGARHGFFFQPHATQALFAGRFKTLIDEAAKPCLEARVPPQEPVPMTGANLIGKRLFNMPAPAYEKLYTRRCEADFLRAAAAVEAATAAFRLEESRELGGLLELVSAYLPAAPVDPFTGKAPDFAPEKGRLSTPGKTSEGKDVGLPP